MLKRSLSIDGASNFRDFGGLKPHGRPSVIAGRLFRSAALAEVSQAGAQQIADIGIRTIIDLRGVKERAAAPCAFEGAPWVDIRSTPVEPSSAPRLRELLSKVHVTSDDVRNAMIENYRHYATEAAPSFGQAFNALADTHASPLLIHCTAGKDRTGFVVAVLLDLLDVPREEILADYETTNSEWDRKSASGSASNLTDEAREALMRADAAYLEAAFDTIEKNHGGLADFVISITGRPDIVDVMRGGLLETH
jgi:protein-tyrosine phosphatase